MTIFPLKLFLKDRGVLSFLSLTLLFNAALWVYLPLAVPITSNAIFLHYTVHFGVDLIDSWGNIFVLPFLGLFLAAVNFLLAYLVYRHKILSWLLTGAAALLQIILLIQAFFLAFINF